MLRARSERECSRSTEQGDELAPSHESSSKQGRNLPHHCTMRALYLAANIPAYVGGGSTPPFWPWTAASGLPRSTDIVRPVHWSGSCQLQPSRAIWCKRIPKGRRL